MEINDYLAIAKRRWWILIGVPLLAGAIAAAVLFTAAPQYTAVATVNAPALVGGSSGQYTGSQAVTQFVAAFQSTAQGAAVDQAVFAKTEVRPGQISDNLVVAQVGGSSAVTITYTSTKPGQAAAVVSTVAETTLSQMFTSQVTLAQSQVDEAKTEVSAANAAINDWGAKNNMVDPSQVYAAQLQRLNALQQTQSSFQAQGNATAAAALNGTITDVQNQLKDYGPKIAEYNDLVATRDSAQNGLSTARQALSQAKVQQSAANPTQVTAVGGEQKVDRTTELISVGIPVVGAGIFLAIALIVVLELVASSRRLRRAHKAEAAEAAAAEPAEQTGTETERGRHRHESPTDGSTASATGHSTSASSDPVSSEPTSGEHAGRSTDERSDEDGSPLVPAGTASPART